MYAIEYSPNLYSIALDADGKRPGSDDLKSKRDANAPENVPAQVFNVDQLRTLFDAKGFPEELDKGDRSNYIECQLWTREFEAWPTGLLLAGFLEPPKTFAVPKTCVELCEMIGLKPDIFLRSETNVHYYDPDWWRKWVSDLGDLYRPIAGETEEFDSPIADKHFSAGTDKGLRSASNKIRSYLLRNDNIPGQSTDQRHRNGSSRKR